MSVQIYGHFSNYLSFANVSRQVAIAVKRRGLNFLVHEIGTSNATYEGSPFPVGLSSQATVGICLAYPPVGIGWLQEHEYKVLMTVCEADTVPQDWAAACNEVQLVVVPSEFCKAAFERSGVRAPILVVPHGIDERIWSAETRPRDLPTRILHISGAASFPQRKGTPQLLSAWREIEKQNHEAELHVKFPMLDVERYAAVIKHLNCKRLFFFDQLNLLKDEPEAHYSYSHTRMHDLLLSSAAVVQPSRGEGFGLLPLEARCAGVPAVLTTTTGHAQHFADGVDIPITTGPMAAMATQGNAAGKCPTLTAEAVFDGLTAFLKDIPGHTARTQKWAAENKQKWYWSTVLKPLIAAIMPYATKPTVHRSGEESSVRGFW